MKDQRGPYFARLAASAKPRSYWAGVSPDDPNERWYFECVVDGGEVVAIRQLTITADGARRAYAPEHLEDEHGFLTDQALRPDEAPELRPITHDEWQGVWRSG